MVAPCKSPAITYLENHLSIDKTQAIRLKQGPAF